MIDYKIEHFDNLCDPITQKMISEWKLSCKESEIL